MTGIMPRMPPPSMAKMKRSSGFGGAGSGSLGCSSCCSSVVGCGFLRRKSLPSMDLRWEVMLVVGVVSAVKLEVCALRSAV